jgi:uncharacterized protein (DUF305 family)
MNKSALLAVVIAFILGFGICYGVKASSQSEQPTSQTGAVTNAINQTMGHTMSTMTTGLIGKTGDALDIAFLEGMIEHHQGAIEMAEIIQKNTKRPELKTMAENIINNQQPEIEQMQGWLNTWYGR